MEIQNEQESFEVEIIEEATTPVDCLCNSLTCP